ncbi:hypothetical protein EZV62_000957 [Acer yangbiense]|uniref:Reverse transcriptase Ty1/copia-type domain-containing protein n=1 Tax=Acer yangbiense TaxID=1000413 RepID=A0A5C7ITH0_9ROSI|nr:hypothetical protein EZV62_000957 [Acer yangbiense]
MPKEEANDDGERGVVTKIPITIKISDNGNDEVQQEVVLEEPRSIAQERLRRVSKPPQRYGWDDENDEVHFALMAMKHTSILVLFALVAQYDMELEQLDVKMTFLHGDLEEVIYMAQPEGFKEAGNENLVCRLKKSLYGLKQSPRQWYKCFDSYMLKIGYKRSEYDRCVYSHVFDDGTTILLMLYVDDMFIACRDMSKINELKRLLGREFDMKDLGVVKKILKMEIKRDRKAGKLWLSQKRYIHKVLEKFSMLDAKAISTPLASHFVLSAKQCPSMDAEMEEMMKVLYANAIGCLMYATVKSPLKRFTRMRMHPVGTSPLEVCGDKGFSCQGGGVINTMLSNDFRGLKFLFDKVEIVDICLEVTCICI